MRYEILIKHLCRLRIKRIFLYFFFSYFFFQVMFIICMTTYILCTMSVCTGCPGANIQVLTYSDTQKYTSQISFGGGLGILSSGHFTYDPLIWLKVTSLSSTASVLRDGKISLKFQESIKKLFFPQNIKIRWFSHQILDFKNLSGSENFSGLNDLKRHDNITGLNDLNSLFGLKKSKTACSVHTE